MSVDPLPILNLLNAIRIRVQDVKIYRLRCRNLSLRCNGLISALNDHNMSLRGSTVTAALNDAKAILLRVRTKVDEWASYNSMMTVLNQRAINEGLNELTREIDACIENYHIRVGLQLAQAQRQQTAVAERDHAELRNMMTDMNDLLQRYSRDSQNLPPQGTAASEIIQNVEEEVISSQSNSPPEGAFDEALRRFCVSLNDISSSLANDANTIQFASPPLPLIFPDVPLSRSVSSWSLSFHPNHSLDITQPPQPTSPHSPQRRLSQIWGRIASVTNIARSPSDSCPQIRLPIGEEKEEEDDVDMFFLQGGISFSDHVPSTSSSLGGTPSPTSPDHRSFLSPPTPTRQQLHSSASSVMSGRTSRGGHEASRQSVVAGSRSDVYPMSSFSTTSVFNETGTLSTLEQALFDHDMVYRMRGGKVEAGTLEGLVEFLIRQRTDSDFDEAFFLSHSAFLSSHHFLGILVRRFNDAASKPAVQRATLRGNTMHKLNDWLNNSNVVITNDILSQINDFVASVDSSPMMKELAFQVMESISQRTSLDLPPSPTVNSSVDFALDFGRPTLPQELAAALKVLEGEKYKNIVAAEIIAHLCNLSLGSGSVKAVLELNQKIVAWVQWTILHCGDYNERALAKRVFIKTAEKCREMHNFSSMYAIVYALDSAVISGLRLTHDKLTTKKQQQLDRSAALFVPGADYAAYRTMLGNIKGGPCIPWFFVHLHDVDSVLKDEESVVEYNNHTMLNFRKWMMVRDRILDALRHRDGLELGDVGEGEGDGVVRVGVLREVLESVGVGEESESALRLRGEELNLEEEESIGNMIMEDTRW